MKNTFRKPHRFKRKKSIFRNRFFWLGILVLIMAGAIFYFFFLSDFFKIEKVIVTGEGKVSKEQIISIVPPRNIFLINPGKIKEEILNKFPQITEVEIKRSFPDALNIVVVERLAVANWCQSEQCFLLDKEGIIFELIETESQPEGIVIRDLQEKEINLGEKVIEKEQLSQILEMEFELKDLKILVGEFIISSEDKLTAVIDEGWEIYFNLQENIEWQLTKLGAVLEEKIPLQERVNLEHIELRFGNFAPYKLKDQSM